MRIMAEIPSIVAKGHSVTAIGPGAQHYYSSMGPDILGTWPCCMVSIFSLEKSDLDLLLKFCRHCPSARDSG